MQHLITENLKGFTIKYQTKPGVFSWKGLDAGTKLLIDHLTVQDGTMVADLGAGAGVLGIVLAKLDPSGHVHLLEDHLRSFKLAEENIKLNGLTNAEVFLSDLFSEVANRTYHQIYANPPAQLGNDFLEELVKESYQHLKTGGSLWLVVPKNIKPMMVRLLEKNFTHSKIVAVGNEHVILQAQKSNLMPIKSSILGSI